MGTCGTICGARDGSDIISGRRDLCDGMGGGV